MTTFYNDETTDEQALAPSRSLNQLLSQLPEEAYQRLAPHLRQVDLPLGQVLYEPRDVINTVYFPLRCMVSLVQVMQNGATIEAGVVGYRGIVGYPVFLGGKSTCSRAVVQIAGSAIACDALTLRAEFERGEALQRILLLYSQALIAQISQTAACNRFHPTEERLARWLLQSQDAFQSDCLELTQDFLASMLGTRRASITLAAGKLQQAGLIRYNRGTIHILDRPALEATACECYYLVKSEYVRLLEN